MAVSWRGQVYVPRIREVDPVPTNLEFEYAPDALYYERQSMIDAMENWLGNWDRWVTL